MVHTDAPIRAAVIFLLLLTLCEARPASTEENDRLHTYPYGSHLNQTIEYRSNFRGGLDGGSYGLDGDKDGFWRDRFQSVTMAFQDAPGILRWLPPLDNNEWVARVVYGQDDLTNVVSRDGRFLFTRLWPGDQFWPPACERMVRELERLRGMQMEPRNNLKAMEVMIKHYGKSLPDSNNHNATILTYVHLYVPDIGDSVVSVFRQDCVRWLSETAGAGTVSGMVPGQHLNEWVNWKGPVVDGNMSSMHLPPKMVRGTSGGLRVVRAKDGSVFAIWIRPTYQL
ncbi:MAG: hypothetical protein M1832_000658 [Thelocarpon impressellum]|nr:MAG: hypothetical protein M1832_000658 [Thelocarpon impressellum]